MCAANNFQSKVGQHQFDRAYSLYKIGDFSGAKKLCDQLLKLAPDNAPSLELSSTILITQKKFLEAEAKLSRLIKIKPDHPNAYLNLGVCLRALGRTGEAINVYGAGIKLTPKNASLYYNRANSFVSMKKYRDAIDDYRNAIELKIDYVEAHSNLGSALLETGSPTEAIRHLNQAILFNPRFCDAYYSLGKALRQINSFEEAIDRFDQVLQLNATYHQALNEKGLALAELKRPHEALRCYDHCIALNPNYAEAYSNRGNVLRDLKRPDEALLNYDHAVTLKPDLAEAYSNRGNALKEMKRLDEALLNYDHAVALKPDLAETYRNRGNALQEMNRLDEALASYDKAIAIKPGFAEAYSNRGHALKEMNRLDEALASYDKAIAIKPGYAEAYSNRGHALKEMNRLVEALASYDKSIVFKPDYAEAYYLQSLIKKYSSQDPQIGEMLRIHGNNQTTAQERVHISFALAKAFDDIGNLRKSFRFLNAGNKLRKEMLGYDIEQDVRQFASLHKASDEFLRMGSDMHDEESVITPIFILGMPRSGTTLVEQIISNHSDVEGAGELEFVNRFGFELATGKVMISVEKIRDFRALYLNELGKLSRGKAYVTDKMPHNFRFMALICVAFPEAKIVHVERNPQAVCWSNYRTYFDTKGLGYCYDIEDITKYYCLYRKLMDCWSDRYTNRIYQLNYDSLTESLEIEAKRLIQHLSLEWEEDCLSPHMNNRIVKTASQQQVKQPVYAGSSSEWRKFEPFLNGAFDSLTI